MGGWEAVVSESLPPPFSLLFSIPFSFPLRSRQLLDLMPISRLLLPFPPPSVSILGAASHPSLISATFPLALYTRSGRRAGGGEFWELGKFNKILMIALSRSPSLLPPSFEASPASPTSSKGRRK